MKDQAWKGFTLSKECVFCKYHPSNAAKTIGTQPTDVQQAAIQNGLCEHGKPWGNFCKECGRGDGLVNK